MFCKRCGKLIPDDAKFCPKCGLENPFVDYKVKPKSEPPKQQPPRPQPQNPTSTQPKVQKTSTAKKSGSWVKIVAGIALAAAVIGLIVNLAGGSSLKGTWLSETGDYSITFSDSETGYFYENGVVMNASERMMNFTYFTDGDKLTITVEETLFSNGGTMIYEFEINGDELALTDEDGYTEAFYKQ
ncbi:MAG: zinc-ribbon domain-containing protein [Clostridia bacterium]|nr:zinc-ribbon domain-containing protein [Clostridia bacterium]